VARRSVPLGYLLLAGNLKRSERAMTDDQNVTPPDDTVPELRAEDLVEAPSHVQGVPVEAIAAFFGEVTSDGLFPAVAFGLDPRGAPSTVAVLTCPITDFPHPPLYSSRKNQVHRREERDHAAY